MNSHDQARKELVETIQNAAALKAQHEAQEFDEDVRAFKAAGRTEEAARLYAALHRIHLDEAREAVAAMNTDSVLSDLMSSSRLSRRCIDPDFRADVERLLREANRIQAIRLYRKRYGFCLPQAKAEIEAWEGELGLEQPTANVVSAAPVNELEIRWKSTLQPEKRL
jgi:hypothetical protein